MFFILYKTTNLINQKEYIGIHQTNHLADGYLGSGLAMKRSINKYGKNNFKREILKYCSSFEELIQMEKEYVNEEWINREDNYNLKTGGNSSGILSQESKEKISKTLKEKYARGEIPYHGKPYIPTEKQKKQISETLKKLYADGIYTNKGKIPWNKNKKGMQIAWNKGIIAGPMSEEQRVQISKSMTIRIKNNPEIKENQSKKLKEYYKSHVHHSKGVTPVNKGIKQPQSECPNCHKMVDVANGKRWHFDNCRIK